MVDNKKQVSEDPEVVIESAIGRTEDFIQKNGKTLLTILIVVVLVVGGFFGYKYLYSAPHQEKASAAIFSAQQLFAADSFATALNGDGNIEGFLQVISKYGSTPSGNLAKHYAGQCYLRMGNYKDAITYFEKFSNVEGIPGQMVNSINAGLTGDAYIQTGDLKKGVSFYEKAVSLSDNQMTAPYYARKAGQVYEQLGDNAKALVLYNQIKNNYPMSMEARDIEKLIGQIDQK